MKKYEFSKLNTLVANEFKSSLNIAKYDNDKDDWVDFTKAEEKIILEEIKNGIKHDVFKVLETKKQVLVLLEEIEGIEKNILNTAFKITKKYGNENQDFDSFGLYSFGLTKKKDLEIASYHVFIS